MFAGCEKDASVLFDTDVLIWALRGNAKAARVIENDAERAVSTVAVLELLQSARGKQEMALLRPFVCF